MSLSIVASQLKSWGDSAALRAVRANDPDSIAALSQAADQFRKLMEAVQNAAAELEDCKVRLAAAPARKVTKVLRTARMGALEFWHHRRLAVEAIGAVYGEDWGVKAPIGETVLVTVPPCWRSATTKRGTKLTWNKDCRMPAARYWPSGQLPAGLEISPDYERSYVWAGYGPPEADCWAEHKAEFKPRDAPWHKDHGYVWDGKTWRFEIEVRNQQNREDAIASSRDYAIHNRNARESAALNYGPQPLAEVEPLLMAAE